MERQSDERRNRFRKPARYGLASSTLALSASGGAGSPPCGYLRLEGAPPARQWALNPAAAFGSRGSTPPSFALRPVRVRVQGSRRPLSQGHEPRALDASRTAPGQGMSATGRGSRASSSAGSSSSLIRRRTEVRFLPCPPGRIPSGLYPAERVKVHAGSTPVAPTRKEESMSKQAAGNRIRLPAPQAFR
jgi:hypothetical protein